MSAAEFYVDAEGKHRWRVQAAGNNEIIAASSEAFETRAGAEDNFRLVAAIQDADEPDA